MSLPDFVPPMLAVLGEPFDSDDHLFEVKWDGMRAMAYVDRDELRMCNRQQVPLVEKYPEFAFLAKLPRGIVLDGEMVVTRDGKPDFHMVMARQHAHSAARIASLSRSTPATFVVFDLLYENFEPLIKVPLAERRARLEKIVAQSPESRLVLSEGILGQGVALFEQTSAQELEGIVAKKLTSTYSPGRRSESWVKIKRRVSVHCAILGYLPDGDDFKSLVIAIEEEGELRCVGLVGSGIDTAVRTKLNRLLKERARATPVIPCEPDGAWVEPGLFCVVSYNERTPQGNLRAPVFERLIVP